MAYEAKNGYVYIDNSFTDKDRIEIIFITVDKHAVPEKSMIGKFSEAPSGQMVGIEVKGYRNKGTGALYSFERLLMEPCVIHLIPYYAWGNRGLTLMRVWIPEGFPFH